MGQEPRAYAGGTVNFVTATLVGGRDVAFELASNVYFVPTLRVLVVPRESDSPDDPLGSQASTGSLIFRYGVGTRVVF